MKKTKRIGWKGCLMALVLMVLPATVHAWSEDILSHFQVYITAEEEYNSNIDSAPNRLKKDDFITTISPGLRFSTSEFRRPPTEEDRFRLDLDFRPGFVFYAKEHEDNYISLDGSLNARYAFTRNLTFRVRDYLIRDDETREQDYSATALPGQYLLSRTSIRTPYFRNVFEPSLEYRFGRENLIALNFRNNIYEINSRVFEGSMENYINPRLTYWFNIKHGLNLEYGLTLGHFEDSPDLVGHRAMGRYTYRFNPRTSIFCEYTYERNDFDPPSIDYDVHRPTLGLEYKFSPTLTGTAQAGYFWQIPEEGSRTTGPSFNLSLTKTAERTTYSLSFQGGYTEDYFTAENRGFTKTYTGYGTISHQLTEKLTVGVTGSMGRAIYSNDQKDWIWVISGNASYALLRWLSLSLQVEHNGDNSNISNSDYTQYRGIFRITATY